MKEKDQLEIKFFKPITGIINPTVIAGFSGVGLVGTLAAQYLTEQLDMEQVGYIDSYELAPIAILSKGEIKHPIRVFRDKKRNIMLFESEFPIPKRLAYELAKDIINFSKRVKAKKIICLEGISSQSDEKPKTYTITSNLKLKKELGVKSEVMDNGIIMGVSAAILLESKMSNIPAACLLVQSNPQFPDGKAAAALVSNISELMNLNISTDRLISEANAFESNIKKIIEKATKFESTGSKEDAKTRSMYG
ncbi:MAG: PAC2 family protein [Candidatus Nanoarchaeia archaeon]|nr:PAC2 family protein [Candidatus Nanoarchaeia archaeon]